MSTPLITPFIPLSPLSLSSSLSSSLYICQMCLDPEGTPEQIKVRGMSAYAGRTFEDIVNEEIAELIALGISVRTSYSVRMPLVMCGSHD